MYRTRDVYAIFFQFLFVAVYIMITHNIPVVYISRLLDFLFVLTWMLGS